MFNPNLITKVTTTGFIFLSTLIGGVQPASANSPVACGQIQNAGNWCGYHAGQYKGGDLYNIEYTNPGHNEKEYLSIVCDRRNVIDWSSEGNLSQGQADWVATEFCALPNN